MEAPAACLRAAGACAGQGEQGGSTLGGSALRLLHCLAGSGSVQQALATGPTPLAPTAAAVIQRWGLAGSVLALEMLQVSCTCAV